MAVKYPVYAEYRSTGSLGLERVPLNWELKRVKHLFEIGRGRVISEQELDEDGQYPVYSSQTKNNGCLGYIKSYDFDCKQITWTTDGANAGTVFLREGKHNCTNVCGTLKPKYTEIHLKFSLYCLEYVTQFYKRPDTNGAKIMNNEMAEITIPQPDFNEKEFITEFLDHETAKIDTLIEKQQQLIKLLKEKRQAVISHAVTKGLNPDVPMRDSGVEWLGDVPEHWRVSSLGYYSRISTGATPDRSNTQYWNGDIPWVKTGEVKYDEITSTEEGITAEGVANSAVTLSPPGTLLMAMYGQGVTRGRVALLGVYATYNQACAAINPNEQIWNKYLRYFFIAAYHAIRDGGNETSQMNLNADLVSKFKITIPTMPEQHKIVDFLDSELDHYDVLIDKASAGINFIQERRTALISAAVTGKIDVRDWQAPESSFDEVKEAIA